MDNRDPGQISDPQGQPGSGGPGSAMPEMGYSSPGQQPGPYQPPQQYSQQQYPPQYPPQQQYGPPPGYAPPPPSPGERKGFNWLACCGISCGVLLVLGIIVFVFFYNLVAPFIGMGVDMEKINGEIASTSVETIESQATSVGADELQANPDSYEGQWLVVTGVLSDAGAAGTSGMGSSDMPNTTYFMQPGIIIMDMSVAPSVGGSGATVEAIGKIVQMDLGKMPFFGKMIEEEMKKDPSLKTGAKMTFLLAKQVTLISPAPGTDTSAEPAAAPGDPASAGNGWQ